LLAVGLLAIWFIGRFKLVKTPVVICVDDEPTVLDSLKVELRRNLMGKCLIETAANGTDALNLLNDLIQDEYDVAVVLADYIMPGLRGDELLHQVQTRSPLTVNIMLSGQADLDAVGRSIQYAHLYRFIAKPWHTDDLKLTIAEAIRNYHKNQKLIAQTAETQQLLKEIKKLNGNLEHQVQERTAQLNHSLEELRELSQLKDDFLHAVSHDLRTPVAGMLLVLRKLQSKGTASVETASVGTASVPIDRSVLDRMVTGCERQLQMLENLITVHASDVHGLQLALTHCQLGDLIRDVCQDLAPLVAANQVQLHQDIPPDLPIVAIDSLQVRRVLENMIMNALKHNDAGIVIQVSAQVQAGMVRCCIRDNGVGMPQDECAAMFERYRQGKNRARYTVGMGLGLHICRQIILAHGGQIGAISRPGEGVEVWFTLPIGAAITADDDRDLITNAGSTSP
jgi:two-component system, sensor histidine kinase and response regulator